MTLQEIIKAAHAIRTDTELGEVERVRVAAEIGKLVEQSGRMRAWQFMAAACDIAQCELCGWWCIAIGLQAHRGGGPCRIRQRIKRLEEERSKAA